MSIIEYTRPASCKDCKYYEVKRLKSLPHNQGWCNLRNEPTRGKDYVCNKWNIK